jgi:hypothetical protein
MAQLAERELYCEITVFGTGDAVERQSATISPLTRKIY